MSTGNKSLGEQYYETVESLKAEGMKNADAVRAVAHRFGKSENSIRGGIHQWKARHVDGDQQGARRIRTRSQATATVDDLLASARKSLEAALALVDSEVDQAKVALDQAQAHYDNVVAGVAARKAEIEQRLRAFM